MANRRYPSGCVLYEACIEHLKDEQNRMVDVNRSISLDFEEMSRRKTASTSSSRAIRQLHS
jgi:hypothetical protein